MIYLVYSSIATRLLSERELIHLLCQSRDNNISDEITGLLLYKNGLFMQLLEGPEEAVERCFERVKTDARHTDVIELVRKPLRMRFFERWSMAFENVGELPEGHRDGFDSFLSAPISTHGLGSQVNEGIFLMLSFKKATMVPHLQR